MMFIRAFRLSGARLPMLVAAVALAALVASYQPADGVDITTDGRLPASDAAATDAPDESDNLTDNDPSGGPPCTGESEEPSCHTALVVETDQPGVDELAIANDGSSPESESNDVTATTMTAEAPTGGGDGSTPTDATNSSNQGSTAAGQPTTSVDVTTTTRTPSTTVVRSNGSCALGSLRPGEHPPACWRPYGSSSPFNQTITGSERLHPRSAQIVARTLSLGPIVDSVSAPETRRDWYHPIYYSTASDPTYTIHCTNPDWGTCEIEGMVVHIPAAARKAAGGDGHLSVIEQHTGWEYDMWKVSSKPAGGGVLLTEWGGRTRADGDGLRSDATAAHFGLAAGVVRPEELAAGEINHALFLLVGCAAREPVFPATGKGAACSDQTDAPAIGHRFWLDMSDAEIDALGVGGWKKTILRAMAHYGGYVGDTGGNEAFAIAFQSASSYTSFGQDDPWRSYLGQPGVSEWNDGVHFNIANGVDWAGRLRVIDPCVASNNC